MALVFSLESLRSELEELHSARMPQLHQESLNEGSAHSLTPISVFQCAPHVPNPIKATNWT
jgi:hypothetical protein